MLRQHLLRYSFILIYVQSHSSVLYAVVILFLLEKVIFLMVDSDCLSNRRKNEANSYASTHIAFPSERETVLSKEVSSSRNGFGIHSRNEEDSLANTRATTAYSLIIGTYL